MPESPDLYQLNPRIQTPWDFPNFSFSLTPAETVLDHQSLLLISYSLSRPHPPPQKHDFDAVTGR